MTVRVDVAVVGSGFAGSLLARILAGQGHRVALLERGTHPRFAIGESSTPLASLSLERLATRYRLLDCYQLATHGRWLTHHPALRRGLKRGFTFYRHHPGTPFADRGDDSERLLVAASPNDAVADTHWLRADLDHHMVRAAVNAGVHYVDRLHLESLAHLDDGMHLTGARDGTPVALDAGFVIDASGGSGFVARHLGIGSALDRLQTRSALVFSHLAGVRLMVDLVPGLPAGPYPDDWAAVHHLIDEGWMYSLRFDDGITSAGFALTPDGLASLEAGEAPAPDGDARRGARLWRRLLQRYPTIGALFGSATPCMPISFVPVMQHRVQRAAGERFALLPSAFAFVDPLFSTGIAWSLRAVERLASCFEDGAGARRLPAASALARYDALLGREAEQIDRLVAGAYAAMGDFARFEAQTMLYFAAVSYAESRERLAPHAESSWEGFLGVDDPVLAPLPADSLSRLARADAGGEATEAFSRWVAESIAPRNVAGLSDPARHHRYPADLDVLVARHALLGLTRDQIVAALPALRGMAPEPPFE